MVFPNTMGLEFVWARERCTLYHDRELRTTYWTKSLRKIKKGKFTLEQTLMIDDSPEKMVRNFGNHIRVTPFLGDPGDKELQLLVTYLQMLRDVSNVRTVEKRHWKNELNLRDAKSLSSGRMTFFPECGMPHV